jgi:hypothetical protein
MFLKMKEKSSLPETNAIILGSSGGGKCYHPWDDLKPCPCGCKERPLLMYKKEKLYFCGGATENVFAVCSVCGRYTEKSDIISSFINLIMMYNEYGVCIKRKRAAVMPLFICLLHFVPDLFVFVIHVIRDNQFMYLCFSKFIACVQTCLRTVFILSWQKFKRLDFCTAQCIPYEI